ncbi:hypothetical protein D3C72_2101300 [compost metagenome]
MSLAIHPQQAAIGIGHTQRIEVGVAGLLEPAQRQYHTQLPRQRGEAFEYLAVLVFLGQCQMFVMLLDAKVRCGKQLLQQNHLSPLSGRFAYQLLGPIKVVLQVPGARHLRAGDGQ